MQIKKSVEERIQNGDYRDWKGRKADGNKHGGIRAASLACGNNNIIIMQKKNIY